MPSFANLPLHPSRTNLDIYGFIAMLKLLNLSTRQLYLWGKSLLGLVTVYAFFSSKYLCLP